MGFNLRCVIVPGHDDAIFTALATVPTLVVRKLPPPFTAIIAAQRSSDPEQLRKQHPELELGDDAAYALIYIEALEDISRRFPTVAFGRIHVDCFGGVCENDGEIVRNGEVIARTHGQAAHQELFEKLGLPGDSWYFEPFTRGFFDAAPRRTFTG
jgi:hypothetical protein